MRNRQRGISTQNGQRKVVGYIRVSTEEQAREGVSLEAQEGRIRAYCEATGRNLDEVICDAGVSAKNTDRAGFRRLLKGVESGDIGAVLVSKIDRATRSVRDLADVIDLCGKHDCDFVSVTESIDTGSAAGRMITNILNVLAQFEREQIGERTAFALAYKRKQRKPYGHVPFGWDRCDDTLLRNEREQHALTVIRKMDAEGVSYRRIANWLSQNGFTPRQGGKIWYAASVRKILLSRIFQEGTARLTQE